MHKTTLMILVVMISSSTCTSGLNAGSGASGADGCGGGLGADAGSAALESGGPGTEGPVVTADAVVVGDQTLAGDRGSKQDETVGKDQALRKDQSVRKDQATVRDSRAPVSKEAAVAPPPASPGQLPTWVGLDWAAFPVDRGPAYPVSGRVWVVSTSGNDANAGTETSPLRAIATALTRAQSGDLVRVHGGTYAEGVANDYRALLMTKDNIVLTSAPGETVTVVPKSSSYKRGLTLSGSNVTVNGINLKGFTPSIEIGRGDKTQRQVVISNLTVEAPTGTFTDGIVDYADTTSKGFASIDGLLIKKVRVQGASLGISCNSGPCRSWRLEDVAVIGGGGSGSGADAIAVESGDNLLFYRVDVSGATADGIDTKATRVVVWDCHVHNLARNGVKLWYGGDVVNTLIDHTGADAALVVKYGTRVRLLHSTIAYHNKGAGASYNMTFRYDDNGPVQVELINSIIYNTSGGAYFSSAAQATITNTLFYGIDNGMILELGGKSISLSGGAAALQAAGLGTGNLVADPGLTAGLRQQAGSAVVNRGKALSALYPTSDLEGKPRIKSSVPDLGPFEEY